MSVKIRLTRTGKSHQVSYRIVAQDTRFKRDGRFLEILGFYNPYNKPSFQIDKERLAAWTKKGAKPTLAVESLLKEGKLTQKVSKKKTTKAAVAEAQKAQEQPPIEQKAEAPAVKAEETKPEPEKPHVTENKIESQV